MRSVIILSHNEEDHEKINLTSIRIKTKTQTEIILRWNGAKTTRTKNQTHIMTDELIAEIKEGKKAKPFLAGENLDYYRNRVQKAYIDEIIVNSDKRRKMQITLKSVILHEKQPDNRDIGLGIPISYDAVNVETTSK